MNKEQMDILLNRKGFIAALDQSGGSSKKTLANYGILETEYNTEEEMFNLIHEMRKRIITASSFNQDKILGAILFEDTVNKTIEEMPSADYLWKNKQILPFMKIDKGLEEQNNGVQLLKDIPELEQTLEKIKDTSIFGTKMRSVIHEVNEEGIKELVEQQFALGKIIASFGLVPIIEPEVDIYAIEKFGCEQKLLKYVQEELEKEENNYPLIFKFTLPELPNFYDTLLSYKNVLKIVALSGGYERVKANNLLKENKNMIASFSRALLEGLSKEQSEEEFNLKIEENITSIYDASCNKDK